MLLENKKALVTGAGRGIGQTIAESFMAEGAEVWGIDYKEPENLKERVDAAGGKFHWCTADLSKLEAVEALIEGLIKESGGFDIAVNNAGITKDNLAFRMKLEDFQAVLNINLTAGFLISRTVARDMIRRRSGSIINMGSVVGIHGNGGQANYAASKGGLIAVTKSLALEVASRSVRVNALAPGFIDSSMTAAMTDAAKEATLAHIPLKRIGQQQDVANAAVFLASDKSSYITGQVLPVDGGMFT
jgi:3-oxoacyl-[acyl-carrier protein] reductase